MQIAEAIIEAENRKKKTKFDWFVIWMNSDFEIVAESYFDNHKDASISYNTKDRTYNAYKVILPEKEGEYFVEDIDFKTLSFEEKGIKIELNEGIFYFASSEEIGTHRAAALVDVLESGELLYKGQPENAPIDLLNQILPTSESSSTGRTLHKNYCNGMFWNMWYSGKPPVMESLLSAKKATGDRDFCVIYKKNL